jgi:hypothetical protein
VPILGEGVAEDDVRNILPLDEHVGLTDREGLRVQLLSIHGQVGLGVHRGQVFFGDRQHAARPGRGVVDRAHDAGLGQCLAVLDEDQVHHQADDLARREMLPRCLVRQFCEASDELLEDEAHLGVIDFVRVQIDLRKPLGDEVEQLVLGKPVDLGHKVESLEDIADRGREALNVGEKVLSDIVLIAHELAHIERRHIGEALPGFAQDERLRVQPRLLLLSVFAQHGPLGGFQNAVQTPENSEGQDDLAIVGLLVVAAQKVRD